MNAWLAAETPSNKNVKRGNPRFIGDLLGRKYVYVVGPKNVVEQRMIDLGATVGELQAVQKGLKDGDVVVSDGLQFIRPGAAVKVKLVPLVSSANG